MPMFPIVSIPSPVRIFTPRAERCKFKGAVYVAVRCNRFECGRASLHHEDTTHPRFGGWTVLLLGQI